MTTHLYLASPLHLVNFEELPRQHKELLFFRYGLPCKDNLEVCNTHLEKGIVLPEKNLVDTDASRDIEGSGFG